MKKKMIALLAGAMMMTAASSAFASFGDLQLTEIVYNATNEYAVNLGTLTNVGGLDNVYTLSPSAAPTTFNLLTKLGATATAATTYVAFYGSDYAAQAGQGQALVSSSSAVAPTSNYGTMGQFQAGLSNVQTNFGAANLTATGLTSAPNSFSGSSMFYNGDFGGLLTSTTGNSMTLASLVANPSLMSIYSIDDQSNNGAGVGIKQFGITATSTDGINFNVAAATSATTPIPAAAYLLGSGLMGLVGLRRKKQA